MKIRYRPEIDGLRAIAVISVILYHAQITIFDFETFKGGFIGVDIFFVISGYLITSIILKELIATGSFSFKHFYERRIRRIIPVLLFVMLASLPFGWMLLLTDNFIDFSKSILYSIGFSSNLYFWYTGQEYAAESGLLKPFLHTWSLSVEEQYYILFPIFLLIIFRYFRKYLIHFLIFGFILSLLLADYGSKNHPSINFYSLPTRGWELLVGSILAYFETMRNQSSDNKKMIMIMPGLGMILILHSIIFFHDQMFHPSFYTLSPILGVSFIIWFARKEELITKILSTKFFVKIGLISYSLYIWHYPVFAFDRISEFSKDNIFRELSLGMIIFILSFFTYYFIEQPFRNKINRFKSILKILGSSIFLLIILNFLIITNNGYKERLPQILQNNTNEKLFRLLKKNKSGICQPNTSDCKFNTSSKNKVYIIGDSHMEVLAFDLNGRLVKRGYQFINPKYYCVYLPGFNRLHFKTKKKLEDCDSQYHEKLKQNLLQDTSSIIIIGGRFPHYLTGSYFDNQEGGIETGQDNPYVSDSKYKSIKDSIRNEVSELSKLHKIILIYPVPEVGWHVNKKIISQWVKNKFSKNFDLEYITTSYKVYKERTKSSFELLDSIQGDNVYRVYPHKLFCDNLIKTRCMTHNDEMIYYRDDDHLSLEGAKMVNNLIIKEIIKIEKKIGK